MAEKMAMSQFVFSGTWNLREALDQLPAQFLVKAERLLSERFFLVRDAELARLSTVNLQSCQDEASQFERYIFRPLADRVDSGEWEIWGHPDSISKPIQTIPAHFLALLDGWDFRNSTLQEWHAFAKPRAFFDGVRVRDISAQLGSGTEMDKVRFLLKKHSLFPSVTGLTIVATAQRVKDLFVQRRWPVHSALALQKTISRVCKEPSDSEN
jgi:hypothetical protein